MAKSSYVCQQCGYTQTGWGGRCPQCGAWGSLVETLIPKETKSKKKTTKILEPVSLSSVPQKDLQRIKTNIPELDNVLGGGFVKGQVVLLAGEPGIGKSTILLQISEKLAKTSRNAYILYISAEESVHQLKLRATRLGIYSNRINLLEESDVDSIISYLENLSTKSLPQLIIIDSIQTVSTRDLSGIAGSVGQVRESAQRLVRLAKSNSIPLIMVGHVTKEGSVAGPATLMHIVDTVLWFEGDKDLLLRILRSIKNRFGPTDEIGLFRMEEKGLMSVSSLNDLFVSSKTSSEPGSVLTSILEGTRPLLVEIQALVNRTNTPYPKRIAQGIDSRRLELIVAVLISRLNIPLYNFDIYANAVGGISVRDPAADLAIALSIISAYKEKPIKANTVAIGELGLMGEIRKVTSEEKRIKEMRKQGFNNIVSAKTANNLKKAILMLSTK